QRFEKTIRTAGAEKLMSRIFLPSERTRLSAEHLAGIFAAKEAVIKALSISGESWLQIRIDTEPSGKPRAIITADIPHDIVGYDISIAHDGGVAIAQCVALVS